MNPWLILFVLCVLAYTVAALVCDVRALRLPNWLTVSAFVAGLVFHAVIGAVEGGVWGLLSHLGFSLLGFACGFGILFVMWAMGMGGGGDVKYMGALGAWLGGIPILFVYIVASIFAGVILVASVSWFFLNNGFTATQKRFFPKHKPNTPEARAKRRMSPLAVPAALATWCIVGAATFIPLKSARHWQPQMTKTEQTIEKDKHSAQVQVPTRQEG